MGLACVSGLLPVPHVTNQISDLRRKRDGNFKRFWADGLARNDGDVFFSNQKMHCQMHFSEISKPRVFLKRFGDVGQGWSDVLYCHSFLLINFVIWKSSSKKSNERKIKKIFNSCNSSGIWRRA